MVHMLRKVEKRSAPQSAPWWSRQASGAWLWTGGLTASVPAESGSPMFQQEQLGIESKSLSPQLFLSSQALSQWLMRLGEVYPHWEAHLTHSPDQPERSNLITYRHRFSHNGNYWRDYHVTVCVRSLPFCSVAHLCRACLIFTSQLHLNCVNH